MPMDPDGKFLPSVKDYAGQYFKDADKNIQKDLKAKGRIVSIGQIDHPYPFCYRSEGPLMYRATAAWFIDVQKIKEKLIANNKDPRWVPSEI